MKTEALTEAEVSIHHPEAEAPLAPASPRHVPMKPLPAEMEQVIMGGDLKPLTSAQRVLYVNHVCQSLGLNPLTRPFDYIVLNGKLTLYARKDAADQLRKLHGISIVKIEREDRGDIHLVTAYAQDREGRRDQAIAAINLKGASGEALANAYMKAETKAKRRVTLSLAGLGFLDESEMDSVSHVAPVAEYSVEDVTPASPITRTREELDAFDREGAIRMIRGALSQLTPHGEDDEIQEAFLALGVQGVSESWENAPDKVLRYATTEGGWMKIHATINQIREERTRE